MQMQSYEAQAAFNSLPTADQKLLRHDAEEIMREAFQVNRPMPDAITAVLLKHNIHSQPGPLGRENEKQVRAYRFFLINAFRERQRPKNERGVA